jgi:uncharacterized membrane protein YesL
MKSQRMNLRQEYADFMEHAHHWSAFMLANVLWCLFTIPIVTIPAATAGLFEVMSQRARGRQADVLQIFFGAMRRLWLKATLVMLVNLCVAGVLTINIVIFPLMSSTDPLAYLSRSVTLFIGLALLLVNIYVWSLMVVIEMPLKQLLTASCKLVFAHPLWSLAVLFASAIPIVISLLLPQFVFLLFTFACVAAIITKGTWRIIRRHLPDDELLQLETKPQ